MNMIDQCSRPNNVIMYRRPFKQNFICEIIPSKIKKENEISDIDYFDFFTDDVNQEQVQKTTSDTNVRMEASAENEYFGYLANPSTSTDMLNRKPTLKATYYLKYSTYSMLL